MSEKPASHVLDLSETPFTIIDNALLECQNLNIYEKMVLIMLKKCAGRSFKAFPGIKILASWVGCSDRQVQKCLGSLQEKDLIKVFRRKNQSNVYFLPNFLYDGICITGKWPQNGQIGGENSALGGGESHSPGCEPRSPGSESGSPGGECHSPGGESRSPRKTKLKNKTQNHPLKSSSTSPSDTKNKKTEGANAKKDLTTILMDEWRKTFGESIPVRLRKKYELAADYMLYLWEIGELPEINKPLAYLKSMDKKGFSQDGWPRFEKRLLQKEEEARKKKEKAEREKKEAEENRRLRKEWQALSETERQKWITEGEKRRHLKLFSGDMKGFLLWLETKTHPFPNK